MPTPNDPTAVEQRSYEEMAKLGQDRLGEKSRQVEECKRNFETLQQYLNPSSGVPGTLGRRER
jgi:hypothetical protein